MTTAPNWGDSQYSYPFQWSRNFKGYQVGASGTGTGSIERQAFCTIDSLAHGVFIKYDVKFGRNETEAEAEVNTTVANIRRYALTRINQSSNQPRQIEFIPIQLIYTHPIRRR